MMPNLPQRAITQSLKGLGLGGIIMTLVTQPLVLCLGKADYLVSNNDKFSLELFQLRKALSMEQWYYVQPALKLIAVA